MAVNLFADDGTGARIEVVRQPEMDTTLDLTWCCFFTMSAKPFNYHYLMQTTNLNFRGGLGLGSFNSTSFINPTFSSWSPTGSPKGIAAFAGTTLLNSGWHHLAGTKEAGPSGSTVKASIYIDGEIFIEDGNMLFTESTLNFSIGDSGSLLWPGNIADVRWYTKILPASEIRTIASQQGKDDIAEGLLMRYPLTELAPGDVIPTAAGSIKDIGPYGFHGQGRNIVNSHYVQAPISNRQEFPVGVPQNPV